MDRANAKIEFSFIIAARNEEKLIARALDNILARIKESGIMSEILMGLDCTDNTEAIARSYAKRFSFIKVYAFRKRMGKNRTVDFLINKAKGNMIINFDSDKLLTTRLQEIRKALGKADVGGILTIGESADGIYLNMGQKLFESTYHEIKLKRYLKGNSLTTPLFACFIFKKSALKKPYICSTQGDDFEVTWKLLQANYRVIYSKRLSNSLIDNPLSGKITPSAIVKRRLRAKIFRDQANELSKTENFSIKERLPQFIHAVLLTLKRGNMAERAEFIEYMAIVSYAIILARIRMALHTGIDPWKYRVR